VLVFDSVPRRIRPPHADTAAQPAVHGSLPVARALPICTVFFLARCNAAASQTTRHKPPAATLTRR